jgi:hypothetical protein
MRKPPFGEAFLLPIANAKGSIGPGQKDQKNKIPEGGSGDRLVWIVSVTLAAALWALSNRADELVLHAVADLAGSLATTAVNQTTQCAAEAILALGHSLLHATAAIRCAICASFSLSAPCQ